MGKRRVCRYELYLHEVEDEVQEQLPPDRLVAVHVGHVLDVGLPHHVLVGGAGDHHHPHLTALQVARDDDDVVPHKSRQVPLACTLCPME